MILASGTWFVWTLFTGRTTRELGATPKLHCSIAPMHTWKGIIFPRLYGFLRILRQKGATKKPFWSTELSGLPPLSVRLLFIANNQHDFLTVFECLREFFFRSHSTPVDLFGSHMFCILQADYCILYTSLFHRRCARNSYLCFV